ncbi:(2Fe-2S)-binding protein [bacterium]|nr:(2Fe-2S)-binding protein [bacterium]
MPITHCYCKNLAFREILAWARENEVLTAEEVARRLNCGKSCRLCLPYIAYCLATGVTEVPYPCPPLDSPG